MRTGRRGRRSPAPLDLLRRHVVERAQELTALSSGSGPPHRLRQARSRPQVAPPPDPIRKLSGFTSRWTSPFACAASSAPAIRPAKRHRRRSVPVAPPAPERDLRSSPSTKRMTRYSGPVRLARRAAPEDVGARSRPPAATRAETFPGKRASPASSGATSFNATVRSSASVRRPVPPRPSHPGPPRPRSGSRRRSSRARAGRSLPNE